MSRSFPNWAGNPAIVCDAGGWSDRLSGSTDLLSGTTDATDEAMYSDQRQCLPDGNLVKIDPRAWALG